MPLLVDLSDLHGRLQGELFPILEGELGVLTAKMKQFITVLEMCPIGGFLTSCPGLAGRPPADRTALARTFIAKTVLGLATTSLLIERLAGDATLRRLCGWSRRDEVPSETAFSRAFAEFAQAALPSRMHEALIKATHTDRLVGHVSRDATAIEARQKPVKVEPPKRCRKKVPPTKGEAGWEDVRRLRRQQEMTLPEMLADLPTHCSVGRKPNSNGNTNFWIGFKMHVDTADGGIPITALLTSASLHDSQAAIPLATITAARITNLYDLMDSAYDAPEIIATSRALGRVPIVAGQARSDKTRKAQMAAEALARKRLNFQPAEAVRLRERSVAERVNARLKDEFGGRHVRVRGHAKVMCHLMFGILALAVDQLMRFVT
jgi:hypothetical protein